MLNSITFLASLLLILHTRRTHARDFSAFCNRLYHSCNTLYVDGGELRQDGKFGVSTILPDTVDTIDLSKPWTNSDTSIWGKIAKNVSGPKPGPQTLNDGSIFSDNSSLFLYGGALSLAPGAPSVPPPNGVWQNNLETGQWSKVTTLGDAAQRLHLGMSVQSSKGEAYYLGGAKTPESDPAFLELPGATPYMVQGLLSFNESTVTFQNKSSSGMNRHGTAAGGFLTLIEPLGEKGVLVTFGGFSNTNGAPMGLGQDDLRDPTLQLRLDIVSIYDIANEVWYQQNATGDIPPWRNSGCAVVVSAPDHTSHSIYVFGGWGGYTAATDGNVYVLSLPSFRWIRVTQDQDLRQRHTCHLMGASTMLVVGGIKPSFNDPQPQDARGCDTSSKFVQGLGIFSLNNHTWTTEYDPVIGATPYVVHPSISHVIGGDENGGATLQTPVAGFSQKALGELLGARPEPNSNDSDSRLDGAGALPAGAIAGIAIGGLLIIATLIGAFIYTYMNRRRRQKQHEARHWPPQISPPIAHGVPPQMKYYSELQSINPRVELRGNLQDDHYATKLAAKELMGEGSNSIEKTQPVELPEKETIIEIHEMEASSAISERDSHKEGIAERQ